MSSNESYHIDIESQEEIKIDGLSFNLQSDRYKIGKQLGRGAFGVVVSAFDRNSDCAVAIKQIPRVFDNLDILLYVTREILVLDILRHPNIVSLRELEFERENLFIVTEKCNANLDVFVRSKDYNRVKCKYIHQIIYQTLQAVDYMHSFNIMHRDIKPENILLDKDLNVKLCDFGLARLCTTIKKENRNLTEYVVTRWYRAPEVILVKSGYGTKQDIWSVGCMIGFMLLRGALFPGQSAVDQIVVIAYILGRLDEADLDFIHCDRTKSFMDKINENNENNLGLSQVFGRVSSVHAPVISLLHLLLNFNPFRRVSALEALSHPLFDQFRKSGEAVHVPSSTSSTTSSSSTNSSYSSKIYPIAVEKAESLAGLARCNNMLSKHSEDELASEIIALRIRLQTQNYQKKNAVAVIPTAVLSSSQYDDVASEVETAGASMTTADTTTRCRRESLPRTNSKTNQLSRLSVDASTTTNDQITDPLNETMIIHINPTEMEQQLSTTATAVPTKQNHNKPTTKKVNSTATASFQHRPLTYDINKHSSERVCYLSASPVEEEDDEEEEGVNGYNEEEEVMLLPVLQVENENDVNDSSIQYSVSEKNKKTTTSRLVSMYRGMTLQASRSLPASPSEKISVAATATAASANKVQSEGTANLPTNVTASTTTSCSPTGHSDLMAGISFILPKTNKIPDLRFKAQNSRLQTITEQQQYLHHQQIQRHRIEVASKRRHHPVRVLTSQPTPTQQSQSQSQLLLPDTTMITSQPVEGTEVVHDTPSQPSCLVSGNSTGSVERLDSSSTITGHTTNTLPKLHHYSVTNELGGKKEKDTTSTSTNVPRCSQYRPVSAILKEGKEEVKNGHHPSSILNPYRSIKFTNGNNGNCLLKGYGGHTVNGNGSLNHDVLDIGTTRCTRTTRTSTTTTTTIREETRRLSV